MTSDNRRTDPGRRRPKIQILNRQKKVRIDRAAAYVFCAALLETLGLPGDSLSVVFVGARTMRGLNRRWRGKDCATDVLSFEYGDTAAGPGFLGDIVIAPEIAARQSSDSPAGMEREVRLLLVHGVLHLAGYDHETDGGEMMRMQRKLTRRKFFSAPPLS
ncbi:MAG: rRNA maturation RNase YbeY [Acidobacteria bacterium]|nr:rRNA maturation RNase YbeY [Acidobacteriota bacterium]